MVEKGKLVKVINRRMEDRYMTTVDGIENSWAEIEYEGIRGFMFGEYLAGEIVNMPNKNWKGKYLFLMEGNQGGAIFSTKLNWYGIYPEKDGEYIEKINVNLEYSLDSEMDDNLKISTNKEERARIIIGTNENIETGRVGIPLGSFSDRVIMNDQILPIPIYQKDCSINTEYLLFASNWKDQISTCYVEKYSLRFCKQPLYQQINYLHTFEGLVERLGECNIPKLFWFGDVNGDEIPDFIFYNQAMYYAKYKFYLSKKQGEKVKFEKVVDFIPSFTPC